MRTLLLFLLLSASVLFGQDAAKPNVILIVIDDMGWKDLGCSGSDFYKTPEIDALAAQGARFTQAYASAPVCSPTRASLMTGKYPARLNLTDWLPGRADRPEQKLLRPKINPALPLSELTLAEVLKAEGYATAHIGKWHLGSKETGPESQGFDLNIGGDHRGTPASYFAPYASQGGQMPHLDQAPAGEYLTDRLTAETEQFIEKNRERPFFIYLPHFTVHIPLRAKEEIVQRYLQAKPAGSHTNAVYAAMIESLDQGIGRIMRKLESMQLKDKTVVVFTSDNGGLSVREGQFTPATSNEPLRAGKGYLYEGGVRVPLIISWPGVIAAGQVRTNIISSVDLAPTIVELAGVDLRNFGEIDGVSFAQALRGGAAPARPAIYWHYPHYSNQGGKPGGAIRAGAFKLIEFYEDGKLELYNLGSDLSETNDLAATQPKKAMELQRLLDAWRRQTGAMMPMENKAYSPPR